VSSPVDIFAEIPRRVRARRESLHLTQAEAAEQLGVSERTLQAWEAGTVPQPRHRRALAVWLTADEVVA
jgi:transcriptional regulator with XRE-family HTH domain